MSKLTLFTWGYWGWGSTTQRFVESVDAVEKIRGYKPPLFVDVRLHRGGMAVGFKGDTFEKLVSSLDSSRYKWMPCLGNRAIKDGGPTQIQEPQAAGKLLELAKNEAANSNRRVIYFGIMPLTNHA